MSSISNVKTQSPDWVQLPKRTSAIISYLKSTDQYSGKYSNSIPEKDGLNKINGGWNYVFFDYQKEGKNNMLTKSFYLVYNACETTLKNMLNRLPITGYSVILRVIFTC